MYLTSTVYLALRSTESVPGFEEEEKTSSLHEAITDRLIQSGMKLSEALPGVIRDWDARGKEAEGRHWDEQAQSMRAGLGMPRN